MVKVMEMALRGDRGGVERGGREEKGRKREWSEGKEKNKEGQRGQKRL